MTNWHLLGHEWAVNMLKQHLLQGAVRHAYLFSGPPGVGRRTLALRFAQALNCPQPVAPGEPCGTCRDCRQLETGQHPDLSMVQAESEGGVLKVEQVREVRRTLVLKPYQARYRVALFLRFQEANDSASNALLKTLEEAPAHAILLLTVDAPEQLLPTVVSRCEVLRLRPSKVEDVQRELESRGLESSEARLIAHVSGGRAGYALRLTEDKTLLEARQARLDDLHRLLSASRVEKFDYAEKLSKDKEFMRQTVLVWLSYWRDVLLNASGANVPLANIDRQAEIEALSQRISLSLARRLVEGMESCLERLEHNVNSRLLAEVTLLDLPHV